jgi:hypothetical protein
MTRLPLFYYIRYLINGQQWYYEHSTIIRIILPFLTMFEMVHMDREEKTVEEERMMRIWQRGN